MSCYIREARYSHNTPNEPAVHGDIGRTVCAARCCTYILNIQYCTAQSKGRVCEAPCIHPIQPYPGLYNSLKHNSTKYCTEYSRIVRVNHSCNHIKVACVSNTLTHPPLIWEISTNPQSTQGNCKPQQTTAYGAPSTPNSSDHASSLLVAPRRFCTEVTVHTLPMAPIAPTPNGVHCRSANLRISEPCDRPSFKCFPMLLLYSLYPASPSQSHLASMGHPPSQAKPPFHR
jgi:hypothetical protein